MKKLILLLLIASQGFIFAQTTKTFTWDGDNREYIEYVPSIYNGSEPVPLVVCLHGLGDDMTNFSGIGMQTLANTENFIVLTPQALVASYGTYVIGTAWNSGASYMGIILNQSVDDIGFLNAMIDSTMALYNIDTSRVYFTGFSMGGFMCHRVACDLYNRVAAVASVAGTIGVSMTSTLPGPMPVLHCHGTADSQVAYSGNQYGNDAEELVNYYVGFNNCNTSPEIDTFPNSVADGILVIRKLYADGDNSSEVEFYRAEGADHQWLYPPTNDLSYTIQIWEFFQRHSKETTVGAEEIMEEEITGVFPNPAIDQLFVKAEGISKIEVFSNDGKLVLSKDFDGNSQINISSLPNGCYFYKISSGTKTFSDKLIIIR